MRMRSVFLMGRSFLVLILAWWAIALMVDSQILMPSPVDVFEKAVKLVGDGTLMEHITTSLLRYVTAFLAAFVISVPLGLLIGIWGPAKKSLYVIVEMLRPIPAIAWIPIALVIFGIGDELAVSIIFYATVFVMIVNTIAGVQSVKKSFLDAAEVLGASKTYLLLHVLIPGSLPGIFIGVRVALGLGWMSIIAAEMIGTSSGLGFLIDNQRRMTNTDGVLLGMIIIAALGFVIDAFIRNLVPKVIPWIGKER